MAKTTKRQKQWQPMVHELTYTNGQRVWQVRYQVGGKRTSRVFPTKAEAEGHAAEVRVKVANEGAAAFHLPARMRDEAAKAIEVLKPYGVTITDAVNHYVKTVLAYRNAPPISEIVTRMVAEAENNKRRDRTVRELRERMKRFAQTFGTRQISSLSVEEVKDYLDDPTLAAQTRIHNATKISQLFNFAIRNGWADTNPVKNITRPSIDDSAPGILTPDQAANLLAHAEKYQLLPYVAIGLFAGLRSAELDRLEWSAVKLTERCIIVVAEIAKRRSRRVVEINDTLAQWLTLCAKPSGKVVPIYNLGRSVQTLATAAGIKEWPHNALRHSFASYHLAKYGDATKTSFQMGNDPVMVHNHYKGLVTNGDVERFWNLRPAGADAADKIVPMKAANG